MFVCLLPVNQISYIVNIVQWNYQKMLVFDQYANTSSGVLCLIVPIFTHYLHADSPAMDVLTVPDVTSRKCTSLQRHVLSVFLCICLIFCISSFELVKSMLPAEHHKVLANIRKADARTKRKKQAKEQQDDSNSEKDNPKAKSQR